MCSAPLIVPLAWWGYEGVSASRLTSENLVPARMRRGDGLRPEWDTPVSVAAESVGAPNDDFASPTPAEVCSPLTSVVASRVFDLRVPGPSGRFEHLGTGKLRINRSGACWRLLSENLEFHPDKNRFFKKYREYLENNLFMCFFVDNHAN